MFGVQSIRETQNIDLVITLEDWSRDKEYDRLGLEESTQSSLEIKWYVTGFRSVRDEILPLL